MNYLDDLSHCKRPYILKIHEQKTHSFRLFLAILPTGLNKLTKQSLTIQTY